MIPQTHFKVASKKEEYLIDLAIYYELAKATRLKLISERRLPPQMEIRMSIEIKFCENIFLNIFKITPLAFQRMTDEIRISPEFQKDVLRMCEAMVGPLKEAKILITPSEAGNARVNTLNKSLILKLKGGRT